MKSFVVIALCLCFALCHALPVEKDVKVTLESVDAATSGDANAEHARLARGYYGGYPGGFGYGGHPGAFGYGGHPGGFGYGGHPAAYGAYPISAYPIGGFGGGYGGASASASASASAGAGGFGFGYGR